MYFPFSPVVLGCVNTPKEPGAATGKGLFRLIQPFALNPHLSLITLRVTTDVTFKKTFLLPCSTLPVRDSPQQAFCQKSRWCVKKKIEKNVALSKALFSLRRHSGSGAREALLPPRVRTNKAKSRHALKRDGFSAIQGVFYETLSFVFYGVFTTTFAAGLFVSSCALTFWICAACSLTVAARLVTMPSKSSTFWCSLRNSLSIIAFTAS